MNGSGIQEVGFIAIIDVGWDEVIDVVGGVCTSIQITVRQERGRDGRSLNLHVMELLSGEGATLKISQPIRIDVMTSTGD